jgi:hypothetical protein
VAIVFIATLVAEDQGKFFIPTILQGFCKPTNFISILAVYIVRASASKYVNSPYNFITKEPTQIVENSSLSDYTVEQWNLPWSKIWWLYFFFRWLQIWHPFCDINEMFRETGAKRLRSAGFQARTDSPQQKACSPSVLWHFQGFREETSSFCIERFNKVCQFGWPVAWWRWVVRGSKCLSVLTVCSVVRTCCRFDHWNCEPKCDSVHLHVVRPFEY